MSIQILNNKDGNQLETVRKYEHSDPAYYQVMNRPLVDLEERTTDINELCVPARYLRLRANLVPSGSVEVEVGYKLIEDPLDTPNHTLSNSQAATQTLVVPACAGGKRRIDVIYYDMDGDTGARNSGTEVAAATAWADIFSASKAPVPSAAKGTNIPLAYLYVDDSPTAFDHVIPIDNAGHIRPCQMGPGMSRRRFNDSASSILEDISVAAVGSKKLAARIDHQHPLHLDDSITPASSPATPTASAGSDHRYCRADHEHELEMETNTTQLKKDTSGGAVGTQTKFVSVDHQHSANITSVLPSPATSYLGGAPGSSDWYVTPDHRHALDGVETKVAAQSIFLTGWRPDGVDPDLTTSSNLLGRPFAMWWWGHFTVTASNYGFDTRFSVASQGVTGLYAGGAAMSSDCWSQAGTFNSGTAEDNCSYHGSWPGTTKEILAVAMQPGNNGAGGWNNYPDVFCSFHLDNIPTTSVKPVIKGFVGPGSASGGRWAAPLNPTITGSIIMMYMYQRTD